MILGASFRKGGQGPVLERAFHTAAVVLVCAMPILLVHAKAAAEIAIDLTALMFLAVCARRRSWSWLRQDWVAIGFAWSAWVIVCSVLAHAAGEGGDVLQAVLAVRFLLFIAALQAWVLLTPRARRRVLLVLAVTTAYVAGQTMWQFVHGANLFGYPRWGDGSFTGPFEKPQDGPTFVRMMFPPLLAAVGWLMARRSVMAYAATLALVVSAVAVSVLIGQRMPLLLTFMGLAVAALLLRRLRRVVVVAVMVGCALVATSSIISPPTFYRLVTKFSDQMEHFTDSHYGQIAGRALVIAGDHPWRGLGFNGFGAGCPQPRYQHGWRWPSDPLDNGGGAAMCVSHPHNHYLQALTDAGVPGLLLFCALVVTLLRRLGRGLWHDAEPLRVGLFVAVLLQEWPIASTPSFVSLPVGGWFFLLTGLGLAIAKQADPQARPLAGTASASPAGQPSK